MDITYSKDGSFQKMLMRLLPGLLPKHGRRAVFLTTLFMEVSKISPSHKELVEDLNKRLKLVNHDAGLKFPMSLKETVWGGRHLRIRTREGEGVPSEKDLEGLARRVIAGCREWTRYDDDEKVLRDTMEVIRSSIIYHQQQQDQG